MVVSKLCVFATPYVLLQALELFERRKLYQVTQRHHAKTTYCQKIFQ